MSHALIYQLIFLGKAQSQPYNIFCGKILQAAKNQFETL